MYVERKAMYAAAVLELPATGLKMLGQAQRKVGRLLMGFGNARPVKQPGVN